MKKPNLPTIITIILFIICLWLFGDVDSQTGDSLYFVDETDITWEFVPTIVIANAENKELIIDFSGDTLKVSGDLSYDEAAGLFLEAINWRYCEMVDSLKTLKEKVLWYEQREEEEKIDVYVDTPRGNKP